MIEFSAPVRIESEMNARCHWSVRRKRFARQAWDAELSWRAYRAEQRGCADARLSAVVTSPRILVTLTRIAPRRLDTDNLASGFKAVRDFIAEVILKVDDGSERIDWRYRQQKGRPKEYAIRVRLEPSSWGPGA